MTGDPQRAERLAEQALSASALHIRRFGPAGSDEVARSELVRSFVADPGTGGHLAGPRPTGRHGAVWEALGNLPARRRAVIVLRFDEGLSEDLIASRMGGTPRSVLADAEAGLLTLCTALHGEPEPGRLVSAALADAGRRWTAFAESGLARRDGHAPTGAAHVGAPAGQPSNGAVRTGDGKPSAGTAPTGTPPGTAPTGTPTGTAPTGTPTGDRPAGDARAPEAHPRTGASVPVGPRPGDSEPPVFATAAFPLDQPPPRQHRWRRTPTMIAAAGVTTLVLGAVAVAVPALLGDAESAPPPAAGAPSVAGQQATVTEVPTRSVPKGLLDWPARGPKGADEQVLAAATSAWRAGVKAPEAPATAVGLLYAGTLEGRQVALLQALDRSGTPRLAQVSGSSTEGFRLVRAERLAGDADVLTVLPAAGPAGPIRVLVSPEGQAADGLLASDISAIPLKKVPLDADGVSQVLPSPRGAPTCSRVVVVGLPGPLGRSGPRVLQSGIVRADLLAPMSMDVEVGSSTLAPGDNAAPETVWFADGVRLAKRAGGGKVVVAALGPRLPAQAMSATDRRVVQSRAYELRRGNQRFVGSVVSLGRSVVCATVTPVAGTGQQPALGAYVLRCPVPGSTAGVLHVVGGPDVQSVQVGLAPTRVPVGQQPYGSSIERPASGATSGFAVLDIVPSGFPCGAGTVQATGSSGATPQTALPVFTP